MKYLWEKNKDIINLLQRESKLFHSPIHGFKHWRTVEKNGLYLSQFNDGDPMVISHFAYFHDCMRVNEQRDDGHGKRGGEYALNNKELLDLTDEQLDILYRACAGHTGGSHSLKYRLNHIIRNYPEIEIHLDTSQHTYRFFEKFGFIVEQITKNGYGEGLDKYDMILNRDSNL